MRSQLLLAALTTLSVTVPGSLAAAWLRPAAQTRAQEPTAADAPADGLVLTGRVGGPVGAAVADGRYVHASFDFHINTFDVTDPHAPRLVAVGPVEHGRPVPLPGNLALMDLYGNRLYALVDWDRQPPVDESTRLELVILEREEALSSWTLEATLELPACTLVHEPQWPLPDMFVDDQRAYVGAYDEDGEPMLIIVDVSDAVAPQLAGGYRLSSDGSDWIGGLAAVGDYVYEVQWSSCASASLRVIDATDAAAPRQIAELGTISQAMDVVVANGYAFVIGCGGLEVFDLSDPARPRSLGAPMPLFEGGDATPPPGPTETAAPPAPIHLWCEYWADAAWRDGQLYAMTEGELGASSGTTYLWRIDVRDPRRPAVANWFEFPSEDLTSLGVGDGFAVASGAFDGHRLIDLKDPDRSRVGATLSEGPQVGWVVAADGDLAVRDVWGFEGYIEFIDLGDEHAPRRLGAMPLSGAFRARDIVLKDHIAYAAISELGFLVIDASDPLQPRLATTVPAVANPRAVATGGTTAYVAEADSSNGSPGALRAFNVSDPARPVELGRLAGSFGTVALAGPHAYAGLTTDGTMAVIDAGDPTNMREVARIPLAGSARQLVLAGARLYALTADTLHVFDVTDPLSPTELSRLDIRPTENSLGGAQRMVVHGDVVYVSWYHCFEVINVHDGLAPRELSVRHVPSIGLGLGPAADEMPTGGDVAFGGHTLLISGSGSGLWTFGAGTPPGMSEPLDGTYRAGFEQSDFAPDYAGCPEDDSRWWYLVPSDDFRQRYEALRPGCDSGARTADCYMHVRFEGRVAPPMAPDVPSDRARSVTVTRLLNMAPVTDCAGPTRSVTWVCLPLALSGSD